MAAAFFLFSIGCLYFILAVISDKRIKAYRAILSWRDRDRDVLPKTSADLASVATESAQVSPSMSAKSIFGRQGEMAFRAPDAATVNHYPTLNRYATQNRVPIPSSQSSSPTKSQGSPVSSRGSLASWGIITPTARKA